MEIEKNNLEVKKANLDLEKQKAELAFKQGEVSIKQEQQAGIISQQQAQEKLALLNREKIEREAQLGQQDLDIENQGKILDLKQKGIDLETQTATALLEKNIKTLESIDSLNVENQSLLQQLTYLKGHNAEQSRILEIQSKISENENKMLLAKESIKSATDAEIAQLGVKLVLS